MPGKQGLAIEGLGQRVTSSELSLQKVDSNLTSATMRLRDYRQDSWAVSTEDSKGRMDRKH